jgi:peptidyl-prolyl cis-trans isomerase SurA
MIATARMFRGLCAAAALMVAACVVDTSRAETVNRIIATIDGEPVTAHELEQYKKDRNVPNATDEQLLDALITDRLLEKEAESKGITVKPDEVDAYISEVKSRAHLDDAGFKKALEGQGLTLEKYKEKVRAELQKTQLVNREIRARVNVSKQEIERYYEANKDRYRSHDGITLRAILISVDRTAGDAAASKAKAKADEVHAKAVGGEDFAQLAAQYSDGPGADNGGLLGTFKKGELEPTLERATQGLNKGDVSEVIPTSRGFYILEVDDVEGGDVKALDDVKDQIRDELYEKALEQRFENWLSRDLRERHSIEVLN